MKKQIKTLVQQSEIVEAIALVQKELKQGLRVSKESVDKYLKQQKAPT